MEKDDLLLLSYSQQYTGSYILVRNKKTGDQQVVHVDSATSKNDNNKKEYGLIVLEIRKGGYGAPQRKNIWFSDWEVIRDNVKVGLYNIENNAYYVYKLALRQWVRGFHKATYRTSVLGSIFIPSMRNQILSPEKDEEIARHFLAGTRFNNTAYSILTHPQRPSVLTALERIRSNENTLSLSVHLHYGVGESPDPEHEFVIYKDTIPIAFLDVTRNNTLVVKPNKQYKQETTDFIETRLGDANVRIS